MAGRFFEHKASKGCGPAAHVDTDKAATSNGNSKSLHLVVALILAASSFGCANSYFIDRGRDAADILTLTAGVGFGVRARVGPLHTGLILNYDVAGLRGGDFAVFTGERAESRFKKESCVNLPENLQKSIKNLLSK